MIIKKNIFLIFIILILYGCGYSKIYSSNENNSFNINLIKIEGDTELNNYLVSNLNKYIENKSAKYNYSLLINTEFYKETLAKDKTGKVTDIKLIAKLNMEYQKEEGILKKISLTESFNIKKNQNNFEQRDYEKNIKRNLSQLLSDKIVRYLTLN